MVESNEIAPGTAWRVLRDSLTVEAVGGGDWCVLRLAVGEGDGPPLHTHPWEEWFRVLTGRLRLVIGERVVDLGPGEGALVPAGTPHSYRGLEPGTEALVVVPRGRALGFFRELDGLDRIDAVLAVAARHGVVVTGPPIAA